MENYWQQMPKTTFRKSLHLADTPQLGKCRENGPNTQSMREIVDVQVVLAANAETATEPTREPGTKTRTNQPDPTREPRIGRGSSRKAADQHREHLEEGNVDESTEGAATKHSGLQRCFGAYDPFPACACVACTLKLSRTFWARLSTRRRVRWATTSPLLCSVGTPSSLRGRSPVRGRPETVHGTKSTLRRGLHAPDP